MSKTNEYPKDAEVWLGENKVAGLLMAKSSSGKAVLVDFYGVEEWLPTAHIEIEDYGNKVEIVVESWLARIIEEKLGEA